MRRVDVLIREDRAIRLAEVVAIVGIGRLWTCLMTCGTVKFMRVVWPYKQAVQTGFVCNQIRFFSEEKEKLVERYHKTIAVQAGGSYVEK